MKHIEFSGKLMEVNKKLRSTELISISDLDSQCKVTLDIETKDELWHKGDETPKPNTQVLAKVRGFKFATFKVLKYDDGYWWQHIPKVIDGMAQDGWVGIDNEILKWKYIDERE